MNKKYFCLILIILLLTACSIDRKESVKPEVKGKEVIPVNDKKIELLLGDTYKLDIKDNLEYKYDVNDNDIISVDKNGIITATKTGSTSVIISSDNHYSSIIEVDVYPKLESVLINNKNISIEKGKELNLDYSITPPGSKIDDIKIISSDTNIVDIIDDKLVAKKPGKVKVTLILNGYIKDTCNIEVVVKPESIMFVNDLINMTVNEDKKLEVIIKPDDTTLNTLKYVSGNKNIVSVNDDGIVHANNKGDTYIEVITTNNIKSKINIHVDPIVPEKIIFDQKNINIIVGDNKKITARIIPSNSDNKTIKYVSTNKNIVDVDSNGKLIAKNVGNAIISAETYNGKTTTLNVHVKNRTFDKTAIFFGDSITYGEFGKPVGYSWANYIGDKYDLKKTVNAGKRNWLISNYFNKRWIVNEVKNHKNEKYDYIIMHGGTNDIHNGVPLGDFDKNNYSGKYDDKTFLGGLETYIYTIKKYWPKAKIGYIINYETPLSSEKRIELSESYYNELKKVLAKWNIKYIDLYSGSTDTGIKYSTLLKVDTKTYLPDGLHLNSDGYELISPYIYNWLKTL